MYWLKNKFVNAIRVLKTVIYRCGPDRAERNRIAHLCNIKEDNTRVKSRFSGQFRSRLLLLATLLLGVIAQAQAGEFCVANPQFNGVVDGSIAYTSPPLNTITQITIDGECAFKNFPASNPLDVTINFQTNDDSIYLITFDNVVFTGNMACAAIDHKLWVVNSPEDAFSGQCQDIIIPAETIAKESPASTAGIGNPFTYTLTLPSMEYPAGDPSPNDLGNIVLTDDLNALGVDLTLVGTPTVSWTSGGAVAHTFTNTAGLLTFNLPNIPAGDQIEINITAVLDDTVNNTPGKQFTNTAKWNFSRAIDLDENGIIEDGTVDLDGDGIIEDEFFDPLPGENGISSPMTIAEPDLVVTKSSTETALNLGIPATFTIDVQNNGGADAWHATILDQLPDTATAGTCDTDPTPYINARIYEADGVTAVSGLLAPGTDYSINYVGAPTCQLTLTMLSSAAVIKPTQRLIINYQTLLDGDTTADGVVLTNIAAATQWFSADTTYPRTSYTKTLTDGTPAVVDHEDSYDITTALSGYYFQKTVQNITTGVNPASNVVPGDTLGYRLRVFNVDQTIDNITITDILDPTKFDTSTFSMISFPAGSTYTFDSVTGELQVIGFPTLSVSQGSEIVVDFEIDAIAGLNNGDVLPNQATLSADGPLVITSDNPYVNGIAAPGDPTDSTDVTVQAPGALAKVKPTQTTASIGEQFTYTITVPAVAVDVPLYDVRILDDLTASNADLGFVSASVVSGGSWTLSNSGTTTNAIIEDTATGIDIPANGQAVIAVTVELQNTTTNQSGLTFNNTASFTYNRANGDTTTQTSGSGATSADMTVIEPAIATISKTVDNSTPTAGEVVRFSIAVEADTGGNLSDVYDLIITDSLSAGLVYEGNPTVTVGAGVSADNSISAPDITGDGSIATPQTLYWSFGTSNADIDIVQGQTVTISYDVRVLNSVLAGATLTNSAVIQWTSIDGTNSSERNGSDGSGGLNDYIAAAVTETLTTPDINAVVVKSRSTDTYGTADDNVRVGDIVEYELRMTMPEGTLGNVVVVDTLPQGLKFEGIVSINGSAAPAPYIAVAPFTHNDILAANIVEAGDATTGSSTVTWNLGDVTNQPVDDAANDFVIIYRARVLNNVFAHTNYSFTLTNAVDMSYDTAATSIARGDNDTAITVLQPELTITKSAAAAGGDIVVEPGELVTYTVDVANTGAVPIYDAVIEDTIPAGMRNGTATVTMVSTERVVAGTTLANPVMNYDSATGIVSWNLDSGVADAYTIPVGETLRIVYRVQVDAAAAGGLTLTNQARVSNYYSFDDEAVPTLGAITGTRESYGPSNTATTTLYTGAVPTKALISPASAEATIGEEIVYQITVPGTVSSSALHDVQVIDTLNTNLDFVSATVTGGGVGVTDNSTTSPDVLDISITEIPAGQQAVIELRTRIKNVATAQQGVAIDNTASYTYAYTSGGTTQAALTSTDIVTVNIVEPQISLAKAVALVTAAPVTAGDILRYTLTLTASGTGAGDNFSDAFDISINDNLSLGLVYQSGTAIVTGAGNTITDPTITGDGSSTAQTLSWNLSDATADIDIAEGTTVTITYDVVVLDSVLSNQTLTNSAVAQWTGVDGVDTNERNGSGTPVENDYETAPAITSQSTPDTNTFTKTRLTDTYGAGDANVRVGDVIEFELRSGLQEGQHNNVVIRDTLPQGLAFESVVHINGDTTSAYSAVAPFTHTDITPATSGDPTTGSSSVTFTLGTVTNASDGNAANDDFVIVYRARVLDNVFAQVNSTTLTNNAQLDYTTASGAVQLLSSTNTTLLQPNLSVTKLATPAGGDNVIVANEVVTYTVDIINNGAAPAYDVVVQDTIPFGMRNGATTITMQSTTLVTAGTSLTNPTPIYNAGTGVATWNLDTGVANTYTIPAGETLRIVYQVQADADLGAGLTLTNQVVSNNYYSFDDEAVPTLGGINGVREIYGPTNTASTTLTSPTPGALLKENPADLTVAVGETITYRVTVPATPVQIALHDVRITDDLNASAADLTYLSVTKVIGSQPWTPENTGTNKNLVIEDTTNGIDIPAGEQVVIDITVQVDDSGTNVSGLLFSNTATYTYNQLQNDAGSQQNGAASTTANMTIVGPDNLTLEKTGPAQMRIGVSEIFTLNVHNTGTAPAWDLTITDILPNPTPGGMCDATPTNITARTYLADGTTPVSAPLVQGTDFVVNYLGDPDCTLTITMQSAAAAVAADNRLIVTYQTQLDADNVTGVSLINVAATTEWFSADTAGAGATGSIRTYTRTLTDGTTAILDHEDAHTVVTELPVISVQKSVINVTTGQDPGSNATPGDTLRYSINITNVSPVELTNFSFVDDLDALNATAAFAAGTLNLVTVPGGADTSNTDINGGSKSTGLVDIRNLVLGAAGSGTENVVIEFEVTLAAAITSGTVVLNQGQMTASNLNLSTDDPNINGVDDPNILGDEDPTETLIASAPLFEVLKTSQDLTGDPAELLAGDTLRYTITVKNIGTENSVNTYLRDLLPANTTYVAASTTLNGNAVTEPVAGTLPLQAGILINAPENTTAGEMRADATTTTTNVATITFDVVINNNVVNGTVISNQAFLNADGAGTSGAITEQPSDDPATATPDDPTLNVIGNQPLVDAHKTVSIETDNNGNGQVDPGDTLRYTITISNYGAANATAVTFTDAVPANTTYVANTVTLNTLPVAQPDGGVSPLISGIDVSSSDITSVSGVPTAGNGILTSGQSAVITFDVVVDGATAVGTVISNQGSVDSNELPIELTDADGIDSNGDQPTLIVVGNAQLLSIIKTVSVVGGGPVLAGGQLEYRVAVTNISSVAATNVTITDNLDLPVAGQLSYVAGSGLLNGATTGVNYTAPVITADYATTYGNLAPGQSAVLVFRATINSALPIGTTITNTGDVSWNAGTQTANSTVSIDIGGTPGVANINGQAWHDKNYDNVFDAGEVALAGWFVDVYLNTNLLGTVTTDASGNYSVNGLVPNDIGADRYDIRFRAPGSNATTAKLGLANSPALLGYTDALHRIYNIVLNSGANVQNLNLPIDPNGVVYNSVIRTPVAGATISLLDSTGSLVPSNCFDDINQQSQVTSANGYYKFDLNFSAGCTAVAGGDFRIQITPPPTGYNLNPSVVITPQTDASTAALDVPGCPGSANDAIAATANICEATVSELAPALSVPAGSAGTNYYLNLTLSNTVIPDDSQLFNNHLPVDPVLNNAVSISKTSSLVNVTRGKLVPYTITVRNGLPVILSNSNIVDTYPAGFKYVQGSARLNGVASEPVQSGLRLTWSNIDLIPNETQTIKLLLIVGAAVNEGEYVNQVQVIDTITNTAASQIATATVRVISDPDFDCSDVIGKVFDDKNLNGYQDEKEPGLAGVKLVTVRGLVSTSDKHGRFHVTCAVAPNEDRGSNFVIKLDERSLPTGYRVTTENPRVQRVTRGKMAKFNFGSALHRVVSMDIADGVFAPGSTEMNSQWKPRIDLLIEQLKDKPSILRLSYLADVDDEDLVEDRLEKVKQDIIDKWLADEKYKLTIETEIFWRRGGPPAQGGLD